MNTAVFTLIDDNWSRHRINHSFNEGNAVLVLCFAAKEMLQTNSIYGTVRDKFPRATIAMCSTAGEIYHDTVQDHSLVAVAMQFDHTQIKAASVNIKDFDNSFEAAKGLSSALQADDLTYLMILSDGNLVNGSELVKGLRFDDQDILVTGGLAADAANFQSTLVGLDGQPQEGKIVGIGFYGDKLQVTHGSQGGWDMFGLEKEITRSVHNVLYEIDNQNALELYKRYLGPDAENLPGSALLFPLSLTIPDIEKPVVRTILSIDETMKTMTFAGDVPVGSKVRFMKASFEKLTAAAASAAQQTVLSIGRKPDLALLVSCVGRKLIYGPRIDEEIEAVSNVLGADIPLVGFYANGEISPFSDGGRCQLHNQTMTISTFYELP